MWVLEVNFVVVKKFPLAFNCFKGKDDRGGHEEPGVGKGEGGGDSEWLLTVDASTSNGGSEMTGHFPCCLSPISDREHQKSEKGNKWQSGRIFDRRANSWAESKLSKDEGTTGRNEVTLVFKWENILASLDLTWRNQALTPDYNETWVKCICQRVWYTET